MGRFRVLAGKHVEGHGDTAVVYGPNTDAGDEFESDRDLDVIFANKFERLDGKTKKPRDRDHSLDASGRVMDDAEQVKVKKKMKGVSSITGKSEGLPDRPGKVSDKSKQGSRARGEDPDAEEIEDPDEIRARGKKGKKVESVETDDEDKIKDEEEGDEEDFGADVSDRFHTASDHGYQVYKSKEGYTLVKDGKPANKTPLDKTGVTKFVKDAEKPKKAKTAKTKKKPSE